MFRSTVCHLSRQARIVLPVCKFSFAARLSPSYSNTLAVRVPARAFSQSLSLAYNKKGFTKEQFEGIANGTLEGIQESLEDLAEKKMDIDIENSAGVLTFTVPEGTYVINKQPPNRQIWLSSPVTGPNRFDWDPINLIWVSERDRSTLGGILLKEIGIEFSTTLPLGYL